MSWQTYGYYRDFFPRSVLHRLKDGLNPRRVGHPGSRSRSDFSCTGVRWLAVLERRGWTLDAKPRQGWTRDVPVLARGTCAHG